MTNPYAPPPADAPGKTRPDAEPAPGGPPGPPAGGRPAGPPPVRPVAPRPPVDPEAVARASRQVLNFSLLLLGAFLVSRFPLPWMAGSLVLVVAALAMGIRALISVRRARTPGVMTPMLVIGLTIAVLFSMAMAGSLATWPLLLTEQQCLRDALTISATEACTTDYTQGLRERQKSLLTGTP